MGLPELNASVAMPLGSRRLDRHLSRTGACLAAAVAACLAACGGSDDPTEVLLAKPSPSVQCATSLTTRAGLDAEVADLRAAGVTVTGSDCGRAGLGGAAVCGAWNGDLWVVTVTPASASMAQARGFAGVAQFQSVTRAACAASAP